MIVLENLFNLKKNGLRNIF